MAKVFVFLEGNGSTLKKGSLELLTHAKASGREVVAGLIGPGTKALAGAAGQSGAKNLFVCDHADLGHYNPETFTGILEVMIKESGADVVLASSSVMARDLFPRVAARLDSGVASDCTMLALSSAGLKARRPLYAGKCTAEVEF